MCFGPSEFCSTCLYFKRGVGRGGLVVHTLVLSTQKQRQTGLCKVEASLNYKANSRSDKSYIAQDSLEHSG